MHQNSRTKRKEFIYLVDQISLEIVCHHRITVIGRFLGAASLVIILDGPRVILLVAEKLGRIVKRTLIARHTLWLYLRVHPLHKLGSGSIKEHGAITQTRFIISTFSQSLQRCLRLVDGKKKTAARRDSRFILCLCRNLRYPFYRQFARIVGE